MTKYWKKGLILFLALFMVFGMLPLTVFASVDRETGMPLDVKDDLVLSIYTPEGKFPGEPAVYGTEKYKNFNSKFQAVTPKGNDSTVFSGSAEGHLDEKILNNLVKGQSSGTTSVWGVFSADGLKEYFVKGSPIIDPENEALMISQIFAVTNNAKKDLTIDQIKEQYEIVWYVIKLQHTPGYSSWPGSRAPVTEWHIDGVVKERAKISINYYGNGNTSGNAPLGVTDHTPGDPYTILGSNGMSKTDSTFLGWSAKADGTGAEIGFYQPGDVIKPTENISLYAMWNTEAKNDATVYTYLDGELTDDRDIHGTVRELYLSKDGVEYIELVRVEEGVYFTKITGNGKFLLYNKNADGTYTQVSDQQLVIYNKEGSMKVHYYSVTYDANGGDFDADPGQQNYIYGESVTAVNDVPTKSGFNFIGWQVNGGNVVDPGVNVTPSIDTPITLVAQWEKIINYTVATIADPENGGTTTGAGTYAAGTPVTVTADNKTGYKFVGWYDEDDALLTEAEEYSFTINADRTLTAKFESIGKTYKNDFAYIFGYNDFTMAAEGPLLRCEAAVMVHRLAKQNNERGAFDYATVKATPTFDDVKSNEWFFSGMEYIAYRGGFNAQMGGMVQPYVQITRGEVFKIIALGLGFTEDTTLSYEGYGELLKEYDYVLGTGNGLETGKLMTRAEFCAMFNRIIGRENALLVDSEGNQITAETYGFKDLANEKSKWYYEIMLRATSAYEGEYVSTAKRAKRNPLDDYS